MSKDLSMEILQESGWEELRKEARKIEGDLDVKLSSYAKLGARVTQGGYVEAGSPTLGSSRSWKSTEMEIQSLLEKLLDVNDSMSRCAASAASTTSVTQKLARHRDILHEFTQEFRRIKGNISSMREHAELLSSVRDDISEYKASGSMSPKMHILRERAAIHGSISHNSHFGSIADVDLAGQFYLEILIQSFSTTALSVSSAVPTLFGLTLDGAHQSNHMRELVVGGFKVRFRRDSKNFCTQILLLNRVDPFVQIDDVINQAQTTRAALGSQRALFGDVQRKVKQLGDKFPVIRGLIGSISRKKSRDTLILSAVIAACTLFLIIYWLSK
ncbi:hypothetical protein H5410_012153 [Solanum commersonii]|uniref:Golgi SNAP receptor complex member 1 n=1 Tax=Solanum commersonii TaxID=4109 RepID=A0A9J6AS26_SOLCO|nr:hypothetical protein H5410_012153 [Solanum commersonii]